MQMQTPMSQAPASGDITSDDKLWGALCWIPGLGVWVAIAMLLMEDKKNRPFIRHNAVQNLAVWVVLFVLCFVLVGVCLAFIAFFVMFYWAYQAYQGQYVTIPYLTDFLKQRGWI